ncbi:MAG: SRPBCC domain-containing protein, partial [Bacteroidota bacterium]|nr:SRPBCC domain-containing protein [Bacteroidota bacterium]
MNPNLQFDFTVDKSSNTINVKREFAAPLKDVWAAWTEAELLDQWWAPKPYRARTKSMDFRDGGAWIYAMIGPDNVPQWCRADYQKILEQESFSGLDAFCDEVGNINTDFPIAKWNVEFNDQNDSTLVDISIGYESLTDLE